MSDYKLVPVEPTRKWAEGISNGLTLSCSRCGVSPKFDYTIADDLWRKVVTDREERLGVICLPCLDHMADAIGESVAEHLEQVQFTGQGKTIVLRPTKTWFHEERIFIAAAPTNPPEISSTSVGVSREEHETMRRALLATAPVVPQTDLRALVGEMRGYVGPDPDNTIEGWCDELEALIERMEG